MSSRSTSSDVTQFGAEISDHTTGSDKDGSVRREKLQSLIAERLGISTREFFADHDLPKPTEQNEVPPLGSRIALIRECIVLVEAYTKITDPRKRLRFLEAIREAAEAEAEGS